MQTSEIPDNELERNDQVNRKIPDPTEYDQIFEEDKHEGMYESLQIRLGKTHLELHKIIAAL